MWPKLWHYVLLFIIYSFQCGITNAVPHSSCCSQVNELLELTRNINDQLAEESNMRISQQVHFQIAMDKIQKQLDTVLNNVAGGGSGISVHSDMTGRVRTIESTLTVMQQDVKDKMDSSIVKLNAVEEKTAKMKEEMDGKLRKLMSGLNNIYDMTKDMRLSLTGFSVPSKPGITNGGSDGQNSVDTNFILDKIDDGQRRLAEQMNALKSSMTQKLEQVEVMTSSLMEQSDSVILEIEKMKNENKEINENQRSRAGGSSDPNAIEKLETSQRDLKSIMEGMQETVSRCARAVIVASDDKNVQAVASKQLVLKNTSYDYFVGSNKVNKCFSGSHVIKPKDCFELKQGGATCNGAYIVYPSSDQAMKVYCDMLHGGWTVIMRRGMLAPDARPLDFDRNWNDYKYGFGDIEREFWIGNEHIHQFTHDKNITLRISLESFEGETLDLDYDGFAVESEQQHYKLRLGRYLGRHGTVGHSLNRHHNQIFQTFERNAPGKFNNCAKHHKGGFWYHSCYSVLLTGEYVEKSGDSSKGIRWPSWKTVPLKYVDMKIRPTVRS